MKKTLVALAAVAATGGAFADSVLTGDFSFGYSSKTANNINSGGMGMGDADIYWATTETLDGGDKVGVNLAIDMGNNTSAYGQAVVVGDETGFYQFASGVKVTVGSVKAGDYLSAGVASAGSGIDVTMDGQIFSARSFKDQIGISIPLAEGLKLGITSRETGTGRGAGAANALSAVPTQRDNTASVDYSAGALALNVGYRTYDGTDSTSESILSSMNRGAISYDLGVAKVGAGYVAYTYGFGNTVTDSLVGVSAPFGSWTVGAQAGYRTSSGSATAANNTTRAGSVLNASYALSKATSLVGGYYSYDAGNASGNTTGYQIKMFKSF